MLDIANLMESLAKERPLFHSEADFQFALAWQIKTQYPDCQIRLERPLPLGGKKCEGDILVLADGEEALIELKYLTKKLCMSVGGEEYDIKEQGAQDLGRYDVCKDIWRVEQFAKTAPGRGGWIILLASDAAYWKLPVTSGTCFEDFRLHEGRVISGTLDWGPTAGCGTKKGRPPIPISGTYTCVWEDYSDLDAGTSGVFRYLSIRVPPQTSTL